MREKTKKCKYCQTEILAKATVCPNCKRTLSKGNGCLISVAIFVIVLAVFVLYANNEFSKLSQEVSRDVDEYRNDKITLSEFNQIKNGMSYDDVKSIVGSPGEVSAESGSDEYHIVIITWYGNGTVGANANVTFTNDEVTAKAQVGLK